MQIQDLNVYLSCPECGYEPNPADLYNYLGCPTCAKRLGIPVNYVCSYPNPASIEDFLEAKDDRATRQGIWRWSKMLPQFPTEPVTLGEGDTPLIRLQRVAEEIGLERVYLKNEGTNPTWSHKDRLAATAITAARGLGRQHVVCASSGNHGAALAAYAARAGINCHVATTESVPRTMRALMLSYGADLVTVRTSEERYQTIDRGASEMGWLPCSNGCLPPVGSTPFGVDGYKTIAYELWEELGDTIGCVIVPVGYGDCLHGLVRGFRDLQAHGLIRDIPKIIAAEVFRKITRAITPSSRRIGPYEIERTSAFSIGGPFTTHQALYALKLSGGTAISVEEKRILPMQHRLAQAEGIYAEASACVALAAAQIGHETGAVSASDTTVVLSTSTGLKDPEETLEWLATTKPSSNGSNIATTALH